MLQNVEPLAAIRNRLGFTQEDFAKKLRISRQHLSRLENSARPLSSKLTARVANLCGDGSVGPLPVVKSRVIPVRSWAQAGAGLDFEELPLDWQKQVPTDCPDEQAFAVEIQGDSMEPRFVAGDIAVLMPGQQPRNGSVVVARLENEGIVFKVFTAKNQLPVRTCSFTSYNPVFQPIEVLESSIVWNFPVYQIVRQVWR
jgi:SOS-response transcriptional repressor LexA